MTPLQLLVTRPVIGPSTAVWVNISQWGGGVSLCRTHCFNLGESLQSRDGREGVGESGVALPWQPRGRCGPLLGQREVGESLALGLLFLSISLFPIPLSLYLSILFLLPTVCTPSPLAAMFISDVIEQDGGCQKNSSNHSSQEMHQDRSLLVF